MFCQCRPAPDFPRVETGSLYSGAAITGVPRSGIDETAVVESAAVVRRIDERIIGQHVGFGTPMEVLNALLEIAPDGTQRQRC